MLLVKFCLIFIAVFSFQKILQIVFGNYLKLNKNDDQE